MGHGVQLKLFCIRVLFNGILYYLVFQSYYLFISVMNTVIDLHFWFLNVCWGVLGLAYARAVIDRVRPIIDVPLKMIELASISLGSNSLRESTAAVFKKFGSISLIVVIDKLTRTVLNKVYTSVEIDAFKKLHDKLANSSVKTVVKFGKKVLTTITDSIDECIVCGCFLYEESLYDALMFSIKNLWYALTDIALSVSSLHIFAGFLNAMLFGGYAYYVIGIWEWDVGFVVKVFLYYYIGKNLLADVIYKPLVYRVVCSRFIDKSDSLTSDYSEEAESILNNIPEVAEIKNIVEKIK